VADFEGGPSGVQADGSSVEVFERDAGAGKALRWTVAAGAKGAVLNIPVHTPDIRPFGLLRLDIRAVDRPKAPIRFQISSPAGGLEGVLPEPRPEWRTVEVALPSLRVHKDFDPARVGWLQIVPGDDAALAIEIDRIALVGTEGGWRGGGGSFVVADFESEGLSRRDVSEGWRSEVLEDGDGHVLRLSATKEKPLFLTFENVPQDLRPFRRLAFRARVTEGSGAGLRLAFNGEKGSLGTSLGRLSGTWSRLEVPIPEMEADAGYDPQKAGSLELWTFSDTRRVLELDDITLHAEAAGWRYTALERFERGIRPAAPSLVIADFEDPGGLDRIGCEESTAERVAVPKCRENPTGSALRWTVAEGAKPAHLYLRGVPRDLREYRFLRFLARADRETDADIQLRIESRGGTWRGGRASLAIDLKGFGRKWKQWEVVLPEMHRLGDFDPEFVASLHFSRTGALSVHLDEVMLLKGAGGCTRTDRALKEWYFGKGRSDTVREVASEGLRIISDSTETDRRLVKKLQGFLDHFRRETGLGPPRQPVEILLLADRAAWSKPLDSESWGAAREVGGAGFARSGTLHSFVQDVESPAFLHELAHALTQRCAGSGGGAWFQDGLADCVGERFRGARAAARYATEVSAEDRTPLAEVIALPALPPGGGGPRLAAAAFVEFLLAGPRSPATRERIADLALLDPAAPAFGDAVAHLLGASPADLDTEFQAWLMAAVPK
jgi:hypothetical protein